MTATAVPQDLAVRSWNTMLRMAAIVAVLVMLAVASFAFGRDSADTIDKAAPISTHAAQVDANSCGHTAHTPPC
jgi:hypothetical protein